MTREALPDMPRNKPADTNSSVPSLNSAHASLEVQPVMLGDASLMLPLKFALFSFLVYFIATAFFVVPRAAFELSATFTYINPVGVFYLFLWYAWLIWTRFNKVHWYYQSMGVRILWLHHDGLIVQGMFGQRMHLWSDLRTYEMERPGKHMLHFSNPTRDIPCFYMTPLQEDYICRKREIIVHARNTGTHSSLLLDDDADESVPSDHAVHRSKKIRLIFFLTCALMIMQPFWYAYLQSRFPGWFAQFPGFLLWSLTFFLQMIFVYTYILLFKSSRFPNVIRWNRKAVVLAKASDNGPQKLIIRIRWHELRELKRGMFSLKLKVHTPRYIKPGKRQMADHDSNSTRVYKISCLDPADVEHAYTMLHAEWQRDPES